jgi:hypothetical protein
MRSAEALQAIKRGAMTIQDAANLWSRNPGMRRHGMQHAPHPGRETRETCQRAGRHRSSSIPAGPCLVQVPRSSVECASNNFPSGWILWGRQSAATRCLTAKHGRTVLRPHVSDGGDDRWVLTTTVRLRLGATDLHALQRFIQMGPLDVSQIRSSMAVCSSPAWPGQRLCVPTRASGLGPRPPRAGTGRRCGHGE